jgi:hypothetical protein
MSPQIWNNVGYGPMVRKVVPIWEEISPLGDSSNLLGNIEV